MINYDQDLFGGRAENPQPEPLKRPQRRTDGYKQRVAELAYPEGLRFWSLAPDCLAHGVPDWVECVWLTDITGGFVRMIINLRTGQKWDGKRDEIG